MTIRSRLLLMLMMLGVLVVGLMTVLNAEAALPADSLFQSSPPLRFDSVALKTQEAALHLMRNGCLEVVIAVVPDEDAGFQVYASCVEWMEVRPASQ